VPFLPGRMTAEQKQATIKSTDMKEDMQFYAIEAAKKVVACLFLPAVIWGPWAQPK
jgi:hypothetical protein